jgi:putative endonuclease
MATRHSFGRSAESLAADYYRRLGFEVLACNYRRAGGEIDVVARRGALLVFCEVKARSSVRWGIPAEAVDGRKQVRIKTTAGKWLRENRPGRVSIRFDVVSVTVEEGRARLQHLPDAFY